MAGPATTDAKNGGGSSSAHIAESSHLWSIGAVRSSWSNGSSVGQMMQRLDAGGRALGDSSNTSNGSLLTSGAIGHGPAASSSDLALDRAVAVIQAETASALAQIMQARDRVVSEILEGSIAGARAANVNGNSCGVATTPADENISLDKWRERALKAEKEVVTLQTDLKFLRMEFESLQSVLVAVCPRPGTQTPRPSNESLLDLTGLPAGLPEKGRRCCECSCEGKVYLDDDDEWLCRSCWQEYFHDEPSDSLCCTAAPRLVLNRYSSFHWDVLGRGGFSIVRLGHDQETKEIVAVKSYKDMERGCDDEDDRGFFLQKFAHEVETFQKLHEREDVEEEVRHGHDHSKGRAKQRPSWYVPSALQKDRQLVHNIFSALPSTADLFIQLLGYSQDASGQPAPAADGVCYCILEIADYTLDHYLGTLRQLKENLSKGEVQDMLRQLCNMMTVLHSKRFVHCDLKPLNIMHFPSGRWKLIDMDGMVPAGEMSELADIFFTPLYCAPEFARSVVGKESTVEVSRLMDVWSLGLIACEVVTRTPVLWDQMEAMETDDFLEWIAEDTLPIQIPKEVVALDPALADLCSRMVHRNHDGRASMVEVMVHPFFAGSEGATDSLVTEKSQELHRVALQTRSSLSMFPPPPLGTIPVSGVNGGSTSSEAKSKVDGMEGTMPEQQLVVASSKTAAASDVARKGSSRRSRDHGTSGKAAQSTHIKRQTSVLSTQSNGMPLLPTTPSGTRLPTLQEAASGTITSLGTAEEDEDVDSQHNGSAMTTPRGGSRSPSRALPESEATHQEKASSLISNASVVGIPPVAMPTAKDLVGASSQHALPPPQALASVLGKLEQAEQWADKILGVSPR